MRPQLKDIYKGDFSLAGDGVGCPCGAYIYSPEQLKSHWEAGHYDTPDPLGIHIRDGVGTEDKFGG
jgi:hypothetical protein